MILGTHKSEREREIDNEREKDILYLFQFSPYAFEIYGHHKYAAL